jgi:hypothetical protein
MAHVGTALTGHFTTAATQTWSYPFLTSVPAGRLLVGSVMFDCAAGSPLPTLTISDSKGNLWQTAGAVKNDGANSVHVIYSVLENSLDTTDQLNILSDEYRILNAVTVQEFDDRFSDSPLDVIATNTDASASLTVGPTATTTNAETLVFAGFSFGLDRTITAGAGYTESAVEQTETGVSPGRSTACEWKYVAATGTQTATATTSSSSSYSAVLVTFGFTTSVLPEYDIRIDWDNDDDFTGTGEDVTARVLARNTVSVQGGRDQARSLSPMAAGSASLLLNNESRDYSPENTSSPLSGLIKPARSLRIRARLDPDTYTLFRGRIDEFDVLPNLEDRSVSITALDGLAGLRNVTLSTRVRQSIRTGTAIHAVLDAAGWPSDLRDIDRGATLIRFWWEEGTDAFEAIQRIVHSEGPSALATVGPDGEFVFRDRHHRLTSSRSTTSQATFTDSLFSPPLVYDAGWRDIVNTVTLEVQERVPAPSRVTVWEDSTDISIASGDTQPIYVRTDDPFINARTPVAGIDYEIVYGTVEVTLSRNSGQSTVINVKAVNGAAQIRNLLLAANPVSVARTVQVTAEETVSIENYGIREFPDSGDLPWASRSDAEAIAELILSQRAERLPIVSVRLFGNDETRVRQMLERQVSDRVTIVDDETGLNREFFIEQVQHNVIDGGKYHETVFGCEAIPALPTGVFVLDVSELDVGQLGSIGLDDPETIFIFGDATQGQFGTGLFAH